MGFLRYVGIFYGLTLVVVPRPLWGGGNATTGNEATRQDVCPISLTAGYSVRPGAFVRFRMRSQCGQLVTVTAGLFDATGGLHTSHAWKAKALAVGAYQHLLATRGVRVKLPSGRWTHVGFVQPVMLPFGNHDGASAVNIWLRVTPRQGASEALGYYALVANAYHPVFVAPSFSWLVVGRPEVLTVQTAPHLHEVSVFIYDPGDKRKWRLLASNPTVKGLAQFAYRPAASARIRSGLNVRVMAVAGTHKSFTCFEVVSSSKEATRNTRTGISPCKRRV